MTEENSKASRLSKHRDILRSIGLVRIDVWVPKAAVPRVRDLEAECSRDVLAAARKAGLLSEQKSLTEAQKQAAVTLVEGGKTMAEVARVFGVNRSTILRIVEKYRNNKRV